MIEKTKNPKTSKKEELPQKDKFIGKNQISKNEQNINGANISHNLQTTEKDHFGNLHEIDKSIEKKGNNIEENNSNMNDSLDAIVNNVINNKNNLINPTKNSIINSSLFYSIPTSSEKQLSNKENITKKQNINENDNESNNDNSSSNDHNILNTHEIMKDLVNNENSNSPNKTENAIYIFDSDDDKEDDKQNKININNTNQNYNNNPTSNPDINDSVNNDSIINQANIANGSFKQKKNDINIKDKENLVELRDNILNKDVNNNKIKEINNIKCHIKKEEKKLFYRRKINSSQKVFKGKNELNIQFIIGDYKPSEALPIFSLGKLRFNYIPDNYRQTTSDAHGYFMKFPQLIEIFKKKVVKNDIQHLCTYYFRQKRGKQSSFDILVSDEKTLNDGVFLNDKIINFYLKILEDEYTCIEGKTNYVLVQRSFFYNSLSNNNTNLSDTFILPDSFSSVKNKINVFTFKTLIIPICEHYHWSLIIVNDMDKMKNIFNEDNLKENNNGYYNNNINPKEECYYPEIFYLDSIYNVNNRRTLIILKYLFYEYQKVYSIKCNMDIFFLHNYNKIKRSNPVVPKQDNSYDCGIFILMYAELYLYNPDYFFKCASKKYKSNFQNNNEIKKINYSNNTLINNENNKEEIINNNNASNNGHNKIDNNYESIINKTDNNQPNNINNAPYKEKNKSNNIINNVVDNNQNNLNKLNNINNDRETIDTNRKTNNENNSFPNNYIINNNIINNCNNCSINILNNIINNKNINIYNYSICKNNTNENINSENINQNTISSLTIHENQINDDKNKVIEKLNNINIAGNKKAQEGEKMKNGSEDILVDKIEIQIENSEYKINNNESDINLAQKIEIDNGHKESQNDNLNKDMNCEENIEESLQNWFSLELINNQRKKIKKLISELNKMEKEIDKNDVEKIIKGQNYIIKNHMEQQKREFDDYFLKKKEKNSN